MDATNMAWDCVYGALHCFSFCVRFCYASEALSRGFWVTGVIVKRHWISEIGNM